MAVAERSPVESDIKKRLALAMKKFTSAAVCGIEPLEARIAPAAFITYTDVDGDLVKITASKGPLDTTDLSFIGGQGGPLAQLTLTDPGFEGAAIAFTVTKKSGGDGQVKVAVINAHAVNLKSVTIKGDLGEIEAGNGGEKFGLGLLSVRALGILGFNDDGDVIYSNAHSLVSGGLGALKVAGDFFGATLDVWGAIGPVTIGGSFLAGPISDSGIEHDARIYGNMGIGNVTIHGDLQGGAGAGNGVIESGAAMGNVKIGRDFLGGPGKQGGYIHAASIGNVSVGRDFLGGGEQSGRILSDGKLGNITIGRDFIGGGGVYSASITAGEMGNLSVGHDLGGGSATASGSVTGKMGNVSIGGDLRGGNAYVSGYVYGVEGMGNVKITGNVIGGTQSQAGTLQSTGAMGNVTIGKFLSGGSGPQTGSILVTGALGNVTIGNNIFGGFGNQSGYIHGATIGIVKIGGDLRGEDHSGNGSLEDSGYIFSEGRIAGVTIGKSLYSGVNAGPGTLKHSGAIVAGSLGPVKIGIGIFGNSSNPALIMAKGLAVKPATGFDLAIASLTVKGDVQFAKIFAGFDGNLAPANADAAIGAVSVGANWASSSLVAGVVPAADGGFNDNDTLQTTNNTGLVARIASISIKGTLQASAPYRYAFLAEHIAKMSIGGKPIGLQTGPRNDLIILTPEFYLHEPAA